MLSSSTRSKCESFRINRLDKEGHGEKIGAHYCTPAYPNTRGLWLRRSEKLLLLGHRATQLLLLHVLQSYCPVCPRHQAVREGNSFFRDTQHESSAGLSILLAAIATFFRTVDRVSSVVCTKCAVRSTCTLQRILVMQRTIRMSVLESVPCRQYCNSTSVHARAFAENAESTEN